MYITINLNNEIYSPLILPEVEQLYKISNYGIIKNIRDDKILSSFINNSGYERISLEMKNGKRKKFYIHRLVSMIFLPENKDKRKIEINHKDGDKLNNYFENLEWVTKSENLLWSFKHGYSVGKYYPHEHVKGSEHYSSIVNEELVHLICSLLETKYSNSQIKEKINFIKLNNIQINSILHHLRKRNSWKYITKLYTY